MPAGVFAVIEVLLTLWIFVAPTPPIVTLSKLPSIKFVPVIVTGVPPRVEPDTGNMVSNPGGVT